MCESRRSDHLAVRRAATAATLVGALLLSMPAVAQNLLGDFGDWILMGDDTMSLALTTDGENIAFGLVCGADCHLYIEPHEPCTEAQAYPVTFETGRRRPSGEDDLYGIRGRSAAGHGR